MLGNFFSCLSARIGGGTSLSGRGKHGKNVEISSIPWPDLFSPTSVTSIAAPHCRSSGSVSCPHRLRRNPSAFKSDNNSRSLAPSIVASNFYPSTPPLTLSSTPAQTPNASATSVGFTGSHCDAVPEYLRSRFSSFSSVNSDEEDCESDDNASLADADRSASSSEALATSDALVSEGIESLLSPDSLVKSTIHPSFAQAAHHIFYRYARYCVTLVDEGFLAPSFASVNDRSLELRRYPRMDDTKSQRATLPEYAAVSTRSGGFQSRSVDPSSTANGNADSSNWTMVSVRRDRLLERRTREGKASTLGEVIREKPWRSDSLDVDQEAGRV